MTAAQIKIALYGGAALLAWWLTDRRPPPSGSVELGVGTIDGVYGKDVYYSAHVAGPSGTLDNPAVNGRMRELIDQSNAAIAQDTLDGLE